MNTQRHNFTDQNIETSYIKKGMGFFDVFTASLTRLSKIRSSRGYGSRKSAYNYYVRNI